MKKIKKKVKRALAAFLKEELMEYIGYNHNIPMMSLDERFRVDSCNFQTMVMEAEIPIQIDEAYRKGDPYILERHIEECKRKMSTDLMKHIHVDAQNLTDHRDYMRRSVKFILRIQTPK